jgi:hypothetical protein
MSDVSHLALSHANLARYGDAWRFISEAICAVETTKERWWAPEVHRIAGRNRIDVTATKRSESDVGHSRVNLLNSGRRTANLFSRLVSGRCRRLAPARVAIDVPSDRRRNRRELKSARRHLRELHRCRTSLRARRVRLNVVERHRKCGFVLTYPAERHSGPLILFAMPSGEGLRF